MNKPIPYPADVRAKGWRFELDHERIEQSDTWALAPAEVRPWLLMLWLTAWRQTPCGSLPADDELIAARIGMPAKTFAKHRAVLRRGWWLAEDGRLYHDTIVEFVGDMMARRRNEAARQARFRAKNSSSDLLRSPPAVTRDSDMTTGGFQREYGTGTGTGTSNTVIPPTTELRVELVGGESAEPTKAGSICKAIKAKGVAGVNPSNPELQALIEKGVPLETFEAAAETCAKATPPKGMAYLLGIVKRQLGEAAAIASGAGMPTAAWDSSRSTIEAMGVKHGIGTWNANDLSAERESFAAYTERVRRAVEGRRAVA